MSSPDEEPCPHVEPVLEADADHGDLTGPPRLLPAHVLLHWTSLPLDLLEETLHEHAVVVHHGDVVEVVPLPAGDGPEQLIDRLDILLLERRDEGRAWVELLSSLFSPQCSRCWSG